MKNFIQKGDVYEATAPEGGITSGEIVSIGAMAGVAVSTVAEGEKTAVNLEGVFEVEKTTGVAMTAGDELYVNTTTKKATKTTTDKALGVCWEDAGSGADKVIVKLLPKKGDANGTLAQAAVVAAESTADGSDAATTQALANALKTKVNAILTSLKNAGLMAS